MWVSVHACAGFLIGIGEKSKHISIPIQLVFNFWRCRCRRCCSESSASLPIHASRCCLRTSLKQQIHQRLSRLVLGFIGALIKVLNVQMYVNIFKENKYFVYCLHLARKIVLFALGKLLIFAKMQSSCVCVSLSPTTTTTTSTATASHSKVSMATFKAKLKKKNQIRNKKMKKWSEVKIQKSCIFFYFFHWERERKLHCVLPQL